MTYDKYLLCAERHLKGCTGLLSSYVHGQDCDEHVWLELYYISGYVIEGLAVYSAYKLNNWPINEDIEYRYNKSFTQKTKLDYYYNRTVGNNAVFPNRDNQSLRLSVQGHHFQDIVKNLLRENPSFENIPYFGGGHIDSDVEKLIDDWSPKIRYYHNVSTMTKPTLNRNIIERLLNTCYTIYNNHI